MKVAVLVKTATGAAVDRQDGQWRSGRVLPGSLGAFDSRAVEEAVRLRERGLAREVVAVAMAASSDVLGGVREALAMGADRAVLLSDPDLDALDLLGRGRVLAALLAREAADLHLFCPWSGDVDGTLLWAIAASRMGQSALAQARSLSIEAGRATVARQTEEGDAVLSAALPCFVDLAEAINKPRHPTMKATLAARSRPLALVRLADLDVDGQAGTGTTVRALDPVTTSRSATLLDDPAVAPERIVDMLAERGLIA